VSDCCVHHLLQQTLHERTEPQLENPAIIHCPWCGHPKEYFLYVRISSR
jgi:rubrerythrin